MMVTACSHPFAAAQVQQQVGRPVLNWGHAQSRMRQRMENETWLWTGLWLKAAGAVMKMRIMTGL
jgi:hypothetical protein